MPRASRAAPGRQVAVTLCSKDAIHNDDNIIGNDNTDTTSGVNTNNNNVLLALPADA